MSSSDAAFRDVIVDQCLTALTARGFDRFRKKNVNLHLHDGFYCWVGLNEGLYRDQLNINPFVGVHVVPLDRLWGNLQKGRWPGKYDRGVATYAVNMGELDSAKNEFKFAFTSQQSDGFVQAEADRLAELYATVGLEFANSIASYEALLPLLKERVPMLGGYPQRVASCLYLMNRKCDARAFVEEFLPTHRDVFEGFAVPFLAKLEAEGA
jgi:hypothetical protein